MPSANRNLYLLLLIALRRRRRKKQQEKKKIRRHVWVVPDKRRRLRLGEFHRLIRELHDHQPTRFYQQFRMLPEQFDYLANLLEPYLIRLPTSRPQPISVAERLAITMRCMATGSMVFFKIFAAWRIESSP